MTNSKYICIGKWQVELSKSAVFAFKPGVPKTLPVGKNMPAELCPKKLLKMATLKFVEVCKKRNFWVKNARRAFLECLPSSEKRDGFLKWSLKCRAFNKGGVDCQTKKFCICKGRKLGRWPVENLGQRIYLPAKVFEDEICPSTEKSGNHWFKLNCLDI